MQRSCVVRTTRHRHRGRTLPPVDITNTYLCVLYCCALYCTALMYLYTGRPSRSHRFHSIKYFSERCCKVKLTLCLSTVNLFSSSRIRMHMSEVSLSAQNDIRRYLRTHTSDVFAEQIRSRLSSGVHHELVAGVRARADAWMSLSGVGRCYEKVSSYK